MAKKRKKKDHTTPSLLEPESTGGDIAEGGFSFQDGFLVSRIPILLSHEGFEGLNREGIGDTEVKYFVPCVGEVIELVEAKDHRVTPAEFWDEIGRFRRIDKGAPGTYRCFTLASVGIGDKAKTIAAALKRVRGPFDFYGPTSPVAMNSFADFVKDVVEAGYTKEDAQFIFQKVRISPDNGQSKNDSKGLFQQNASASLQGFGSLTNDITNQIYDGLLSLVRARKNKPISRKELEGIVKSVSGNKVFFSTNISLHTGAEDNLGDPKSICFAWDKFWGSDSFPPPRVWKGEQLAQLSSTKDWIDRQRDQRTLLVEGKRRLSSAFALGSVFSAVSGYHLDINHRDKIWSTSNHAKSDTTDYVLDVSKIDGDDSGLVVVIGIIRNILPAVKENLGKLELEKKSLLALHSEKAIESAMQSNLVVQKIKSEISTHSNGKVVHLFFAGPSPLAFFLAHRLNATATFQCYEWNGRSYDPTCRLFE